MKIFVISTINDRGYKRRLNINYDYTWWRASTTPDPLIKRKWLYKHNEDTTTSRYNAKLSCFTSHYRLLKHIVENKIDDVVICEDDSVYKNIDIIKTDGITLLNGKLHHPTNYSKDKDIDIEKYIKKFSENIITKIDYSEYRTSGAVSIYYPNWILCHNIINKIENGKDKLTHFDLWLNKHKFIKYLQYPSPFKSDDTDSGSSIHTKKYRGCLDNYTWTK